MGAAKTQGNAKTLRGANGNVGAEFARVLEQCQCEDVGSDDDDRAGGVGLGGNVGVVDHTAVGRRILQEDAEETVRCKVEGGGITDHRLDVQRFGSSSNDSDGLRMAV